MKFNISGSKSSVEKVKESEACATTVQKNSTSVQQSEKENVRESLMTCAPSPSFCRGMAIDQEPDSLDNVIANPQSYPITIVPNRPTSFYGLMVNGKPFNRQASYSINVMQKAQLQEVQVLKDIDEHGEVGGHDVDVEGEKQSNMPRSMLSPWKYPYLRHVSMDPSANGGSGGNGGIGLPLAHARLGLGGGNSGVYYEALKGSSNSVSKVSRNYRPGSVRKVRRRAVFKNGDCNVLQKNLTRRRLRFLQDMYTTLVDSQWRWTLLAFALSFILSWLIFAVLWWLIMYTHGDLEDDHLPNNQADNGWAPCVSAIDGFTSCFLFSIETQHTIGYGVRTTSPECPEAIFMMCFQSIYGVMSSAFMAGIVFAKMTRAKQRAQTLLYSKNAVICQRDGNLTLMFRVGDMRKSHIIGASVRAQLIRTRTTQEGEVMTQHLTELEVGSDDSGSDLFFIWPMVIEHKIDENSPLYNLSATDLLADRFEIVVILEGTVESTGQSTQARSSYINTEILWGHRFDPVVTYNKYRQAYEVDYARFNETTQVDTPLCSARELNEYYKIQEGFRTPDTTFAVRQMSLNLSEHAS